MSQEFLAQLLRSDNRVISDPGQPCHVCLQDCGTMSGETGIIECRIRLPCSHVIGSACIAKWLRINNTCPVCRHKFFPPQPRPSDSDSDDEDEDEDEREAEAAVEEGVRSIAGICAEFRGELQYSPTMRDIVPHKAVNVHWENISRGHTPRCAVAIAVYMVSHIMDEIQTLDEISRISNIPTLHLRAAYRLIYPRRERLIHPDLPAELVRSSGVTSRFLAFMPAPSPENDLPEGDETNLSEVVEIKDADGQEIDDETRGESLVTPEEFCDNFCIQLGYDKEAVEICQSIAGKIHGRCLQDRRSPRRTAAVGVFMASHLAGFQSSVDFKTSVEGISNVVGVSEAALREDYATVYSWRGDIIDADMLACIGTVNIKKALQAVPPLNWPAL